MFRSTYSFNGQTLTQAGVYNSNPGFICQLRLHCETYTFSNDTTVNQNQALLTAVQNGATYQWVDCSNNFGPIPGATNQSYTKATANGSYAVIITANGCTDTSACHNVTTVGINDYSASNG